MNTKSRWTAESIAAINQYIDECIEQRIPIRVSSLAREFGYSQWHFSSAYRAATGQNITDYINNARMEKACMWLADSRSEQSCQDIAYDLGFFDPAHFTNTFKRHYRQTPQEYRRIHSNNAGYGD